MTVILPSSLWATKASPFGATRNDARTAHAGCEWFDRKAFRGLERRAWGLPNDFGFIGGRGRFQRCRQVCRSNLSHRARSIRVPIPIGGLADANGRRNLRNGNTRNAEQQQSGHWIMHVFQGRTPTTGKGSPVTNLSLAAFTVNTRIRATRKFLRCAVWCNTALRESHRRAWVGPSAAGKLRLRRMQKISLGGYNLTCGQSDAALAARLVAWAQQPAQPPQRCRGQPVRFSRSREKARFSLHGTC